VAAIPSQQTAAVAQKITAALWNDDVRDAVNFFLATRPLLYIAQGTGQTGWTSATFTSVTFAATDTLDRDGQHDPASNNSRVVIGNTLGWYRVSGLYVAPSNTATTLLRAQIALNGTAVDGSTSSINGTSTGGVLGLPTTGVVVQATAAADYIELQGYQQAASGTIGTVVSSAFRCSLAVEWLGT
jgi:hypothetical protein